MPVKIENICFPADARIIVVADIHARVDRLQELLATMQYNEVEDYLIIVGDIIEKGPKNIATLTYIQTLAAQHEKVIVLEGNCEAFVTEGLHVKEYMEHRGHSIMLEWLQELGIDFQQTQLSEAEINKLLRTNFAKDYAWLEQLPTVLLSEQFVFVHAGVARGEIEEAICDRETLLNIRYFIDQGHDLPQTVIVGHFPVVNYCVEGFASHAMINNKEKRIIAIDGGNQVDPSGQLNGLLITLTDGMPQYEAYSVDDFQPVEVVTDVIVEQEQCMRNAFWPYGFEPGQLLEQGNHFSRCIVADIEEPLYFKNEYITIDTDKKYTLNNYHVGYKIPVQKGEHVRVIDDKTTGYAYIKKDGILGWLPKKSIQG